jgi:addiction module HigA family antidote
MVRIPTHRPPMHPGTMLEKFLSELNMTQSELATHIGVPFKRVNLIVNQRRGITPDTALRLSRLFGTTPDLWLNLQLAWDLWHALQDAHTEIRKIRPLWKAS